MQQTSSLRSVRISGVSPIAAPEQSLFSKRKWRPRLVYWWKQKQLHQANEEETGIYVRETDSDGWCLAGVSPPLWSCPPSHLKTDRTKGCLTGDSGGLSAGKSDGRGWTGCSFSCFCPDPPPSPPPVQALMGEDSCPARSSPVREVMSKQSWPWQEGHSPVCPACGEGWRSDGWMMYLQTAWQRKSVVAGMGGRTRKRKEKEAGVRGVGFEWHYPCCFVSIQLSKSK